MVDNIITLFESDERVFDTCGICSLFDALSCKVTEELNGIYELELTYPISGIAFRALKVGRIIHCKSNNVDEKVRQAFRIYSISVPINGIITINAQHISYDLSGYPTTKFKAKNVEEAATGIIQNIPGASQLLNAHIVMDNQGILSSDAYVRDVIQFGSLYYFFIESMYRLPAGYHCNMTVYTRAKFNGSSNWTDVSFTVNFVSDGTQFDYQFPMPTYPVGTTVVWEGPLYFNSTRTEKYMVFTFEPPNATYAKITFNAAPYQNYRAKDLVFYGLWWSNSLRKTIKIDFTATLIGNGSDTEFRVPIDTSFTDGYWTTCVFERDRRSGSYITTKDIVFNTYGNSEFPFSMLVTGSSDWLTKNKEFEITNPVSARAALGDSTGGLISIYDCELEFDNFTIFVREVRGTDNHVVLRKGIDVTDLKKVTDYSNVCKGIYPFANSSSNVVLLDDPIYWIDPTDVDFSKVKVIDFTQEFEEKEPINKTTLLEKVQKYVEINNPSEPRETIEVTYIDLSRTSDARTLSKLYQIDIGDSVHVQWESEDRQVIDSVVRCTRLVYNVLLGCYDEVTLGTPEADVSSKIATTMSTTDIVTKTISSTSLISTLAKFVGIDAENGTIGKLVGTVKDSISSNDKQTVDIDGDLTPDPEASANYSLGNSDSSWDTAYLNSSPIISSARCLKKDISGIPDKYDILFNSLKPRLFRYKNGNSNRVHIGFIVDELKDAMDAAGIETDELGAYILFDKDDADGPGAIRYEELVALNTKEIQVLKNTIAELEEEVKKLKNSHTI